MPIQKGFVARTTDEVKAGIASLEFPIVIKAQVPVGGRGKAGGIKLANDAAEALEKSSAILGMDIKGIRVKKILVAEAVDIGKEIYLGIVQDRRAKAPVAPPPNHSQ